VKNLEGRDVIEGAGSKYEVLLFNREIARISPYSKVGEVTKKRPQKNKTRRKKRNITGVPQKRKKPNTLKRPTSKKTEKADNGEG